MNLQIAKAVKGRGSNGFTLTEMMVAATLLSVVVVGVVSAHITGMKMVQITKSKLGASDEARKAISKLTDEVRAAKWLQVGCGSATTFDPVEDGERQENCSLEIYSTANTTPYIRYYLDGNDRTLKRVTSGDSTPMVIAQNITNDVVFAFENSAGEVLTASENNRVLALTLQFYQIQYPITRVGPGQFYDFYQLRTRITRRTLDN
jgi:prepilin-type N-terminal cleavage/methylation domain-containing protein